MNYIPIKKDKIMQDGKEVEVFIIPAMSIGQTGKNVKKVPHPMGTETIIAKSLQEAHEIIELAGFSYIEQKMQKNNEVPVFTSNYKEMIYDTLIKLTKNETSSVVAAALKSLGEIKSTKSIDLFIDKMGEDNELIRTASIEGMQKFGTQAYPYLVEALSDKNWVRRNSALICIGYIAEIEEKDIEKVIVPVMNTANDANTIVRTTAAKILGIIYKRMKM